MKKAALSDLKAKLAKYIRLVKAGEQIEIQDRGVPVAILTSLLRKVEHGITPPRVDPRNLAKMKFKAKTTKEIDVVSLLREDRDKR